MAGELPKARVLKAWPGGPGRGAVITPANGIREKLIKGGFIELVEDEDTPAPARPVAGERATRKGHKGRA